MRILPDTHTLIWWLAGHASLSIAARDAIAEEENKILVSTASAMELSTKFRLGKLPDAAPLAQNLQQYIDDLGFEELPITVQHAGMAGSLQIAHKEPFDRLLIVQSLCEGVPLVSKEKPFDGFGVNRIW